MHWFRFDQSRLKVFRSCSSHQTLWKTFLERLQRVAWFGSSGHDQSTIALRNPLSVSHEIEGWRSSCCKGSDLIGTIARHPMHALGGFFAKPRPFLPGDFVTTESGTGLVHMAPDHGEDDFALCKAHGIDPVFAVEGDGKYRADWAWLGGEGSVINPKFNAPDGPICAALREAGGVLAGSADYKHSYPHSWRSKAKVIYRCTPQWFVPMDKPIVPARPGPLRDARKTRRGTGPSPRRCSRTRPQGHHRHPLRPRQGPQPHRLRWSKGAPTGCSAASAPGACRSRCSSIADRRVPRRSGGQRPHRRRHPRKGVDAWSRCRAQEYLGPATTPTITSA